MVIIGKHIKNITDIQGLSDLNHLEQLNLSNNEIEKISGLEDLVNLESLTLTNNHVKKIEGLDKLNKLKRLVLKNNQISDLSTLNNSGLTDLEHLDISNNNIQFLPVLSNLKNLRTLYLFDNPVHSKLKERIIRNFTVHSVADYAKADPKKRLEIEVEHEPPNMEDYPFITNWKGLKYCTRCKNIVRPKKKYKPGPIIAMVLLSIFCVGGIWLIYYFTGKKRDYCPSCGQKSTFIDVLPFRLPRENLPKVIEADISDKSICPFCNNVLPTDRKVVFCMHCGVRLEEN